MVLVLGDYIMIQKLDSHIGNRTVKQIYEDPNMLALPGNKHHFQLLSLNLLFFLLINQVFLCGLQSTDLFGGEMQSYCSSKQLDRRERKERRGDSGSPGFRPDTALCPLDQPLLRFRQTDKQKIRVPETIPMLEHVHLTKTLSLMTLRPS